MIRDGGRALYP